MATSTTPITGPSWDNSTEYPSLQSKELAKDLAKAQDLIEELFKVTAKIAPLVAHAADLKPAEIPNAVNWAHESSRLFESARVLLLNVDTFVTCEASVDGRNADAKTLGAQVQAIFSRLGQAYNPAEQFLKLTSDAVVEKYLADPKIAPERFSVTHGRKLKDFALSLGEEDMSLGLGVDGHTAWGTLYDNLSGATECTLDLPDGVRKVGLAEAASLSQSDNENVRKVAFRAVQKGWETHEESVAAILNALAGWRLEHYRRRSTKKPMHFLDEPLHNGNITSQTLDAMMGAVGELKTHAQRGLKLQAQLLGKKQLDPWDLFAPCPTKGGVGEKYTFDDALHLISDAFSTVHPDMGAFVGMMAEKKWIEGTVGPTKRPGAYCTNFPKSRTPRVYMTYTGGMRELKTLAHELGHAFHNWVMRDQPLIELGYPMTLAETASIFAETVVSGALVAKAKTPADRLQVAWSKVREFESLCLNIPARFHFEKAFYERRLEAPLNPTEFKALMTESWSAWYGDTLSEMDSMFWASKLHFSIPGMSFYNYPYTFGYLFALGVYAQKDRLGSRFHQAYVNLLRDTGRMTAEEVAIKHLDADLTKPDFWRQSLAVAKNSVDELEAAIKAQ